ncbi:MAG: OmpA family protein [Thiohalomonadales bacterium]|nr:OmpA family protein [Thiohalomonadales bacterium]
MRVSVLSLAVALSTSAMAADKTKIEEAKPRQYLSPMLTYVVPDNKRDISNNGGGADFIYGRQLSDHVWWETNGSAYVLETNVQNFTDFYQMGISTGLAYAFGDRKSFTPFVIGAIGGMYDDVLPDQDDSFNLQANVGIGAVTGPIFDNGLKLRAEARYVYDDFDGTRFNNSAGKGGFGDVHVSVGLEIPLGYTKVIEKEKIVYQTKEVVKNVPVAVKDSDGDGIPDDRDQCPNTLPGGEVDGKGCLLKNQTISFNNIGFELNSSKITASSRPALDKLATSLKAQTDFNVEIAGHTDSTGSAEYNQKLSEARAKSVRQYLIDQGVDANRLTSKGYGELEPVASNDTASGRAMNRRVEFRVSE